MPLLPNPKSPSSKFQISRYPATPAARGSGDGSIAHMIPSIVSNIFPIATVYKQADQVGAGSGYHQGRRKSSGFVMRAREAGVSFPFCSPTGIPPSLFSPPHEPKRTRAPQLQFHIEARKIVSVWWWFYDRKILWRKGLIYVQSLWIVKRGGI